MSVSNTGIPIKIIRVQNEQYIDNIDIAPGQFILCKNGKSYFDYDSNNRICLDTDTRFLNLNKQTIPLNYDEEIDWNRCGWLDPSGEFIIEPYSAGDIIESSDIIGEGIFNLTFAKGFDGSTDDYNSLIIQKIDRYHGDGESGSTYWGDVTQIMIVEGDAITRTLHYELNWDPSSEGEWTVIDWTVSPFKPVSLDHMSTSDTPISSSSDDNSFPSNKNVYDFVKEYVNHAAITGAGIVTLEYTYTQESNTYYTVDDIERLCSEISAETSLAYIDKPVDGMLPVCYYPSSSTYSDSDTLWNNANVGERLLVQTIMNQDSVTGNNTFRQYVTSIRGLYTRIITKIDDSYVFNGWVNYVDECITDRIGLIDLHLQSNGILTIQNKSDYPVWGVSVSTASDPQARVTYTDNAVGMEKGSIKWDNTDIFRNIRTCLFKNQEVVAYLSNQNQNYYESGALVDWSSDDVKSCDVMVEIPRMGYILKRDGSNILVKVTTDPDNKDFSYAAFSDKVEGDSDMIYISSFFMNSDNASYPSSTIKCGDAPTMISAANNRGYEICDGAIMELIQCLFLLRFGTTNSRSALGYGVVGATAKQNTGRCISCPMNYGTTANMTTSVKFIGLEDIWGNCLQWLSDIRYNDSKEIIYNPAYRSNSVTLLSQTTATSGFASNLVMPVSGVHTCPVAIPNTLSATSGTFFCDYVSYDPSVTNNNYAAIGAKYNSNGISGLFSIYLDTAYTGTTITSARLVHKRRRSR